ncbi:MAG: hypothetical protein WD625_08340 [Balneolales bacterium]
MKFPTHVTSKISAFILAIFITVGCAGINDANFSNDTDNSPILEEKDYGTDGPDNGDDPILDTEEREDIIVPRPPNDD